MAATPKDAQKVKINYNISKPIYDNFARKCTSKGYAPHIIVERFMKKYTETGQI
jgi:hypothetical protein